MTPVDSVNSSLRDCKRFGCSAESPTLPSPSPVSLTVDLLLLVAVEFAVVTVGSNTHAVFHRSINQSIIHSFNQSFISSKKNND